MRKNLNYDALKAEYKKKFGAEFPKEYNVLGLEFVCSALERSIDTGIKAPSVDETEKRKLAVIGYENRFKTSVPSWIGDDVLVADIVSAIRENKPIKEREIKDGIIL